MRRGTLLALGLLLASTALPAATANAGPRDLPRALFGVITRPLGAILGGVPRPGRRVHRSRRSTNVARDRKPPAAVQAPAPSPAAGAVAAGAAGAAAGAAIATGTPADAKPGPDASPAVAKTQDTAATAVPAQTAPSEAQPAATQIKPVEAKPVEAKPADMKSADTKPAETKAAESKPSDVKPAQATAAAPQPAAVPAAQRNAALSQAPEALQQQQRSAPRPASAQAEGAPTRFGVAGPATWPTAFEDVVGYALWPAEFTERLRAHGIGDVLGSVFGGPRARASYARNDSGSRETVASGAPYNPCTANGASGDWPAGQIERGMELNATQRQALAQLKSAVADAAAAIRASCRDESQLPPSDRLKAMQNTLWLVHDAALQIRGPLARFYDSLSDAQRKTFAAPPAAQADPRTMNQAAIARMCGAPSSGDAAIRQLETALGQSKAQRASLETFQRKSSEMGQFLMASCLKPVPATPAERLDAAADRLTAVIFAASTVNLAFNDLYNQLSDDQKAKFNAAGR